MHPCTSNECRTWKREVSTTPRTTEANTLHSKFLPYLQSGVVHRLGPTELEFGRAHLASHYKPTLGVRKRHSAHRRNRPRKVIGPPSRPPCVSCSGEAQDSHRNIAHKGSGKRSGQWNTRRVCPNPHAPVFQIRQATARGIRTIALHEDAHHAAGVEGRNLYMEIADLLWDLIFITPEGLLAKAFNGLLANPTFLKALGFIFVDEMHLVDEWGGEWRKAYRDVGLLRTRLPSRITWGAWSATLVGDARERVRASLGFIAGDHEDIHLPCDRVNIIHTPRFYQGPISGTTFPDVAYLVPCHAKVPADIDQVLIYCETIEFATRMLTYLESLLPQDMPGREWVVMPYHSLISPSRRQEVMDSFGGRCRLMIATLCVGNGLDVRTPTVSAHLKASRHSFSGLGEQDEMAHRQGESYSAKTSTAWKAMTTCIQTQTRNTSVRPLSRTERRREPRLSQ